MSPHPQSRAARTPSVPLRDQCRLYAVVGPENIPARALGAFVVRAARGGAGLVQLRAKHMPRRDLVALARRLVKTLAPYQVPLIVNDDWRAAAQADAAGCHLGQSDLGADGNAAARARAALGKNAILGLSVETPAQLDRPPGREALAYADYLGAGPVFATGSKDDAAPPLGLAGLAEIAAATRLPVVAIGGITLQNAPAAIAAGAAGVAVISALTQAPEPRAAARALRRAVDSARAAASAGRLPVAPVT